MDTQIVTRGIPATADEWLLADRMPVSELPELTDADRSRARMRHLNDEQHRKHLALRILAKKRELQEAQSLGQVVNGLLRDMESEYRIRAIVKRGLESGWHILLESLDGENGSASQDVYYGQEIIGADNVGRERLSFFTSELLRPHLLRALELQSGLRVAS